MGKTSWLEMTAEPDQDLEAETLAAATDRAYELWLKG